MPYKVSFSDSAFEDYISCVEYLLHDLESPQAANSLIKDVDNAIERLSKYAGYYDLCDNPNLAMRGIRRIRLKHRYKLFFHIDNDEVIIDAMLHNLQDFEARLL